MANRQGCFMKEFQKLFGMRVKELREKLGHTQEELARMVCISPKYLSRIELGYNFPTFKNLMRLSGVLDVELRELFEFNHLSGNKEDVREDLKTMLDRADEETLRLLAKMVNAVVR